MADRDVFREIPLDEFRRQHDHVESRISIGQIASIRSRMFAVAYSVNRHLERSETAVNFSVDIKPLETPTSVALGVITARLTFYSSNKLQPIQGADRIVTIHPQTPDGTDAPAIWKLPDDDAFHTPNFSTIREGFLTHWVDGDISDAWSEEYEHPERSNLTANSPLLHQRSPFMPPTKRDEP